MAVTKRYLKDNKCKCTFRLPKKAAENATDVHLVGEFNQWSTDSLPMTKLKNGDFKVELTLESGRDYQYRFLIDQDTWENDWEADAYVPAEGTGSENSVIKV